MKHLLQITFFPLVLSSGLAAMLFAINAGMNLETSAMLISVAAIAIIAAGERLMPHDAEWNRHQKDVGADLTSLAAIVAVLQPLMRLFTPIATVAILRLIGKPDGLGWFPSDWPLWLQLPLFAVGVEFGKYWMHRWGHENAYLWRFHSSHHSPKRIYWLNGFLLHPVNFLYAHFAGVFLLLLTGAGIEVLLLHTVFEAIGASFQHANIKLRHGFLSYIFSTNEVHFWHHSTKREEANTNYGALLIVWDHVFRTYYRPTDRKQPAKLGIGYLPNYPVGRYWKQLVSPFCWKRCVM
jgi:ornithine lipid hydroxylase